MFCLGCRPRRELGEGASSDARPPHLLPNSRARAACLRPPRAGRAPGARACPPPPGGAPLARFRSQRFFGGRGARRTAAQLAPPLATALALARATSVPVPVRRGGARAASGEVGAEERGWLQCSSAAVRSALAGRRPRPRAPCAPRPSSAVAEGANRGVESPPPQKTPRAARAASAGGFTRANRLLPRCRLAHTFCTSSLVMYQSPRLRAPLR